MRDRASQRLTERGLNPEITLKSWTGRGQGAALTLSAEFENETKNVPPATFVALGARGKPAEHVADEAVDQLLAYLDRPGSVDPHSADQLLLPLALADGPSSYSVTEVTEHLRTNALTLRAFLNRPIRILDPSPGQPGRVEID
jgi:RNA 3'-terminal phosphate cyclase (ATP)